MICGRLSLPSSQLTSVVQPRNSKPTQSKVMMSFIFPRWAKGGESLHLLHDEVTSHTSHTHNAMPTERDPASKYVLSFSQTLSACLRHQLAQACQAPFLFPLAPFQFDSQKSAPTSPLSPKSPRERVLDSRSRPPSPSSPCGCGAHASQAVPDACPCRHSSKSLWFVRRLIGCNGHWAKHLGISSVRRAGSSPPHCGRVRFGSCTPVSMSQVCAHCSTRAREHNGDTRTAYFRPNPCHATPRHSVPCHAMPIP